MFKFKFQTNVRSQIQRFYSIRITTDGSKNVQNILITVSSVQSVTAGKMNQTFIWNKAYLLKEPH